MPKRFPAIQLVAKHGRVAAIAIACLPAVGAIFRFVQHGSATRLLGGLVIAAVFYAVLRLAVELIEVIAETLLPR